MGPVIAEMLQKTGCKVTFITTSDMVCSFGNYTSEQPSAQKNLNKIRSKINFFTKY